MQLTCAGRPLVLGAEHFVAEGGQARVYARDGVAYKVFTGPGPDPARLAALQPLSRPGVIGPQAPLLDPAGATVGFSMRFLAGWHPLVRLFPRVYRERHGLDVQAIGDLVLALRDLVLHAHTNHACIVDLNEMNVLVAPDHRTLALIDVDSWQLPGFPAVAIAPGVQDHRTQGFDARTDWFAFAVVTFQLFAGIHPFRGAHPGHPDLPTRVRQGLSVFHPKTVVPPMAELRVPWRAWYQAVFDQGLREPPPTALTAPDAPYVPVALPDRLQVRRRLELPDPIQGMASWDGRTWFWTERGLYEERRRIGPAPTGALPVRTDAGIGFLEPAQLDGFEEVVAWEGRVHARNAGTLVRIRPSAWGPTQTLVCALPRAARLYRGCAVASVLGTTWLTVLDEQGAHTTRCPPLDGCRVIDAEHAGGVTVVITREARGFTRHRIGPDGHRADPTDHPAASVCVLPSGVALVQDPQGLELFGAHAVLGPNRRLPIALPRPIELANGTPGTRQGCTWTELTLA